MRRDPIETDDERMRRLCAWLTLAEAASGVGTWTLDVPTRALTISDGFRERLGLAAGAEPSLDTWLGLIGPDDRGTVTAGLWGCIERGIALDVEVRLVKGGRARVLGVRAPGPTAAATRVHGVLSLVGPSPAAAPHAARAHTVPIPLAPPPVIVAPSTTVASAERLGSIAEAVPVIVWTAAPDGELDYSNHAFSDYTGASASEPVATRWRRSLHPDDARAWVDAWNDCVRTGSPYAIESRLRRRDGEFRWFRVQATAQRDESGAIIRWCGSGIDIHELRTAATEARALVQRAETESAEVLRHRELLRQTEERFRLLAAATNLAVWDWDLATDELWWSDGFAATFGLAREDLAPTIDAWMNRIHPADQDRVAASLRATIFGDAARWSSEHRLVRRDGSVADVLDRGHVVRDRTGRAIRVVGGTTDVSEQRQVELRRPTTPLDHAQDAILVRDLDHRILYWNRGEERLLTFAHGDGAPASASRSSPVAPRPMLPRGNGEVVLVVDGDEQIRRVASHTLERFGYRVMLASNGAEAVAVYAQHRAIIDVVITDMAMPIMDGPTTIVALGTIDPEVCIIGASGQGSDADLAKAVGAGLKHFVPKPYTAESILTVIARALADRG